MKKQQKIFVYIILVILVLVTNQNAHAQCYTVGVPVIDTVGTITAYGGACLFQDELSITLDSTLIPYVTGLNFQVEITAINGNIWSNLSDTLNVGGRLPLPAPVNSGILTIFLGTSSSFEFITTIVGTPTVVNESYYTEINETITLAMCNNGLVYFGSGQLCEVQPSTAVNNITTLKVEYSLSQNYPNPFNPATEIRYALPEADYVEVVIYNIFGQVIKTLVSQNQAAGYYSVAWDGKNKSGEKMSSGIYYYKLTAGEHSLVRKMTLLK